MEDDASSSTSSSSDDEYLAMNSGDRDRESLVRRKLLESFYGKSAVAAAQPADDALALVEQDKEDDDGDDDEEEEDDEFLDDTSFLTPRKRNIGRSRGSSSKSGKSGKSGTEDLDSASFDARAHTQRHIAHSNVQHLLEVEETLALQVRTLDSTMQTLVYENYSRFIDATDAIKSIGIHVQANDDGLTKLASKMERVDLCSKETEQALGALRDQVAEKIRVKRLLSRLSSLLELPQTLRLQIAQGKYRTATKNYLSARTILANHSQGFESLKTIETECTGILQNMKQLLTRKLHHWNGMILEDGNKHSDNDTDLLEPPKTMHEIFECVGTLYILLQDQPPTNNLGEGEEKDESLQELDTATATATATTTALNKEELQSMAMGAATRALDRILDAHMIQVQEHRFALGDDPAIVLEAKGTTAIVDEAPIEKGAAFVSREFLDAILEVATLYGMTFSTTAQDNESLTEFISEAFGSFLTHIRSILLDESSQLVMQGHDVAATLSKLDDNDVLLNPTVTASEVDDDVADAKEEEISNALTLLVRMVQEMASGLALPEVGVNPQFCETLVTEALTVADSMVTRRIYQKFYDLRINVVKTCLVPFAERLLEQHGNSTNDKVVAAAQQQQLANSTLSDCLQLVDDTIRSIVAAGAGGNDQLAGNTNIDNSSINHTIKEAVQENIRQFTDWLAGALEVVAGGERSGTKCVVDVSTQVDEDEQGNEDDEEPKMDSETAPVSFSVLDDDARDAENIMELVDSVGLILKRGTSKMAGDEFSVAIAEMCRLAQNSIMENLIQSMAAHFGTAKKRSRLFEGGALLAQDEEEDEISERFRLAASRIFALYAQQKGAAAAAILVSGLGQLPADDTAALDCEAPQECAILALEQVKALALECSEIFGGPSRAGIVPEMDDGPFVGGLSSGMGAMRSSLQFDVDRIFKEKLPGFLHPSETLDLSRNTILFLMLNVALRGWYEGVRACSFSNGAFKQLQVNVEFLKLMIGHYIDENYQVQGNDATTSLTNLLSDTMAAVSERCSDESCETDEFTLQESKAVVRDFMSRVSTEGNHIGARFIINKD